MEKEVLKCPGCPACNPCKYDKMIASNKKDNPEMQFIEKYLKNIKDLNPEFSKIVDENFWDLI